MKTRGITKVIRIRLETMKVQVQNSIANHQLAADIFQFGPTVIAFPTALQLVCLTSPCTGKVAQSFTHTVATVLALSYTAVLLERGV